MHTLDSNTTSAARPIEYRMHPALPPVLVAVAAGCAASYFGLYPSFSAASDAAQFGGTLASVGTTMLGFMLAALAVLASINHTHLVAMMRKNGHYEDLLSSLFVGCLFFLACATLGFALVFGAPARPWLLSIAVGAHLGALVSLLDVGRKFQLVLTHLR